MNRPTLVLLPGMDGTGRLFVRFIGAAAASFDVRVIAYPPVVMDYAKLDGFVRRRLPTDRPYVVLAESFSGPIAAALRGHPPAGLVGIVLCASFIRNPRPRLAWAGRMLSAAPVLPVWRGLMHQVLFGRYDTSPLRAALDQVLGEVPMAVLRERLRNVLGVDASDAFRRGHLPVLCLRARHDRLVPASAAAHVQALAPEARVVDIQAPHFLLQVAPMEALHAIEAFVKELPLRAA